MPLVTSANACIFLGGIAAGGLIQTYRKNSNRGAHVSVVSMKGTIGPDSGEINVRDYGGLLDKAFSSKPSCVALVVNSPGGTPAQSSMLFKKLRTLRREHSQVPLLCFVEDHCCSGAYFVACACDEILVDEVSVLGSIGVITKSFGIDQALENLGVDRRVQTNTAGRWKGANDPFSKETLDGRAQTQFLLDRTFSHFEESVRAGRGDRLMFTEAKLEAKMLLGETTVSERTTGAAGIFDGSVYDGRTAVRLGLADVVVKSDMITELRQRFGDDIHVRYGKVENTGLLKWVITNL